MSYPKVTTPRGVAIWPRLNDADTKFNAAGKFGTKIAIDGNDPDLPALQAKVEELIEARYQEEVEATRERLEKAGKKGLVQKAIDAIEKVSPFKAEEDDDTGEETGNVIINATMTATGISKKTGKPWSRKPTIYNGKGKKIDNPPAIGSGSILKLNVELFPYFAANDKTVGVSFRLEAAQVIKLVSFGERSAADCGFGAEEDGDDFDNSAEDFDAGRKAGGASDADDGDDDL